MSLWRILAIVAAVIFLVVLAVPTHWLVVDFFWLGLSWAFFLVDGVFGGPVIAVPAVTRRVVVEQPANSA